MFGSYPIGVDALGTTPIAGEFLVLTLPAVTLEVPFTLYQFQYRPSGATDSAAVALTDSEFFHYWLGRAWHSVFAGDNIFDFAFRRTFTEHTGIRTLSPGMLEAMRSTQTVASELRVFVAHMVNFGLTGLAADDHRTGAIQAFDLPLTRFETDNAPDDYQAAVASSGNTYLTPDPTAVNTFRESLPLRGISTLLLSHQGRLVALGSNVRAFLAGHFNEHAEVVRYSEARRIDIVAAAPSPSSFEVEEIPSLYGAAVSMSNSDLFMVKFQGGAVVLSGDIDNPNVLRLPLVESTYGIITRAISCPLGAVYGSRNGIFVWQNGESSVKLSRQLDGMFYDFRDNPESEQLEAFGRFGWFHPWLCVPGGWLYDSRSDSWWRLVDPATHGPLPNVYRVGPITSQLYAFSYKLTPTANKIWTLFDSTVLASQYSWQSQPLLETRDRRLMFQTINLIAQRAPDSSGDCTVAVTLTGINEDGSTVTPITETFALSDNANPQQLINHIHPNFSARYVQVRIVSTAETGPAPKVHIPLTFGVREDVRALRQ